MIRPSSIQTYLEQLHARYQPLTDGAVADYIPELTKADPEWFGIALITVDGHVHQVGDTREPFTIQSISKAFAYGIALEDSGVEQVAAKIDVEPSGEAFNSISLEPDTGRPRNPMINAGAIVTTGLVSANQPGGRIGRILDVFGRYAGHPLEVDQDVYASERDTGHRNRAISHMLRNYDILESDPEPTLDCYFRQCSIRVTARDLALMGATLANSGVNPINAVRAVAEEQVPRVLSVMATCGMYDYSGNWIYRVGMPAKSGVGGGIVAVLPGQFGLAVFSPRLDPKGNSVRGIKVCEALSRDFGLHMLRTTRMTSSSVVRTRYSLAEVQSKLYRVPDDAALLQQVGDRAEVVELTGELVFSSAEIIATLIGEVVGRCRHLILDLRRVTSVDQAAARLVADLYSRCREAEALLLLTGTEHLQQFVRDLKHRLDSQDFDRLLAHAELDAAIEWCEDRLLAGARPAPDPAAARVVDQPLCADFAPDEAALLESLLVSERYPAGALVCSEGDPADRMYFLASGRVSTWIQLDGRHRCRVFASTAGWSFGESALFGGHTRTASVVADTDVELQVLEPGRLEASDHPAALRVRLKLFRNLAGINMDRLKAANGTIRTLMQ